MVGRLPFARLTIPLERRVFALDPGEFGLGRGQSVRRLVALRPGMGQDLVELAADHQHRATRIAHRHVHPHRRWGRRLPGHGKPNYLSRCVCPEFAK